MLNLKGHAILITRPTPQARGMAALVTAAGGFAIVQPGIRIAPAPDDEATLERLQQIDRYDAAIFTSPNAVQAALEATPRREWVPDMPLFAVGPATRRALLQRGFPRVTMPEEAVGGAALAPFVQESLARDARVLLVAAPGGKTDLAEALGGSGMIVDWCYAYRRLPGELSPAAANMIKAKWGNLVVTATSGAILRSIAAMIEKIVTRPLVVPSSRLRDEARELGYGMVAVAARPDDESILHAAGRFIDR